MAVLLYDEIIFVQVVNEMPVFIAHRSKHAYHLHVHRDGWPLLLLALYWRIAQRQQCYRKQNPQFRPAA